MYQKPSVVDCQDIFSQISGTLASYIASKSPLKVSLITIVPSMANFKSDKFVLTENNNKICVNDGHEINHLATK